MNFLMCAAPLPRAEWVEVGSRPPATPDKRRYFFPDGPTRARPICDVCAARRGAWRSINSLDLSDFLMCA